MPIDALSLVVCTMMGLALGVDYSLLIVSRFREELAAGRSPTVAAAITRRSAGRTTAIAGVDALLLDLPLRLLPARHPPRLARHRPGRRHRDRRADRLGRPARPARPCSDRASTPARSAAPGPGRRSRVAAAASAALRRPALAAAAIVVPLLLLAAPALAFNTGSPGVDELSSSSSGPPGLRNDLRRASAPGWQAPFLLTVAADDGPITGARAPRLPHRDPAPHRGAARGRGGDRPRRDRRRRPAAALARRRARARRPRPRPPSSPGSGPACARPRARSPSSAAASAKPRRPAACSAKARPAPAQAPNSSPAASAAPARAANAPRERSSASPRDLRASPPASAIASATAYNLSLGLGTLLPNLSAQGLGRARHLAARLRSPGRAPIPTLAPAAHEAAVLASVLAANREELARLRAQARDPQQRPRQALRRRQAHLRDGSARLATEARPAQRRPERTGLGRRSASPAASANCRAAAETLSGGLAEGSQRAYPLQQRPGPGGRAGLAHRRAAAAHACTRLHRLSPRLFDSGFLADGRPRRRRPDPALARRRGDRHLRRRHRGPLPDRPQLGLQHARLATPRLAPARARRRGRSPPRPTAPGSAAAPRFSTTTAARPNRACPSSSARSS